MAATSIQWTDHSINPIRARDRAAGKVGHYCEKVSAGCANCYSSRLQVRFGTPSFGSGQHLDSVDVFLDENKLHEVLRRKKPTKFFWCDMTDLFGSWVTDDMLIKCFATMAASPQHTHQVLTKRPERMADYLNRLGQNIEPLDNAARLLGYSLRFETPNGKRLSLVPWPIPSIWCGTSVENQAAADERIPLLIDTPAAVRFLSCEPLLEAIDISKWLSTGMIHWVICGGES